DDYHAVERDTVAGAAAIDLHAVPLARLAAHPLGAGSDRIHAAAVLIVFELGVALGLVVENLHFDAGLILVSRLATVGAVLGYADIHARVAAGQQLVIQPHVEIAILLLGAEPRTLLAVAYQQAVFHVPARG